MALPRRNVLRLAAGAAGIALTSRLARAQTFPTRTITIVVPFPAGGPTDTLGRILADRMKTALGQAVIIENLTGAAGTIGSNHVARSSPDGYTLVLGHWQTHVVNGATFSLQFDVVNDFEPIALIADCPMWLVGRSGLSPQNLPDLVAWLKDNPGKATVGIGGVGGGADVVGTYFQRNTGTRVQFVPYRGAAPMMQDLLAGHIDLTFTQVASALAQVRSGQVKAYAVMAKTRWAETADTPTSDEGGVPGAYGRRKGRQRASLPSSIPLFGRAWPIPRCANASSNWGKSLGRLKNRRRKLSLRSKKPRSKNGGLSSRRRESEPSRRKSHAYRRSAVDSSKRDRHLAVSLFGVSNNRQCCSDRVNPYWGHPQLYQTCVQYIQVSALASPMRAVRSNASSETSNVKMSWSISI
jgi:tripartite-type tricarboxylate transporter receptor subunit TctC